MVDAHSGADVNDYGLILNGALTGFDF